MHFYECTYSIAKRPRRINLTISFRNFFICALLILAGSLSAWSIMLSKHTTHEAPATPDKPDGFMEEVKATIMDKEGKPRLKVETPILTHYAENDATELTKPHVTIYRQSPQPWHINSNFAKTKKGIQEITFSDHVIIHHLPDLNNPMTKLETSTLTVFPDQQLAKTQEAITMTQPSTTIRAVGMLANWDQGTVELLSQAREEYVPNS